MGLWCWYRLWDFSAFDFVTELASYASRRRCFDFNCSWILRFVFPLLSFCMILEMRRAQIGS